MQWTIKRKKKADAKWILGRTKSPDTLIRNGTKKKNDNHLQKHMNKKITNLSLSGEMNSLFNIAREFPLWWLICGFPLWLIVVTSATFARCERPPGVGRATCMRFWFDRNKLLFSEILNPCCFKQKRKTKTILKKMHSFNYNNKKKG